MTPNNRSRSRSKGVLPTLVVIALMLALLLSFLGMYAEFITNRERTEFLPVSLLASLKANYSADPTRFARMPSARLDLISDTIADEEPGANVADRFATVQANLLTPVAWLYTPTATRTSIPSTPAPPRDPWIVNGAWRAWCRTEIALAPVRALRMKFQMIGGGGPDNHISFACCGSSSIWWLVDNNWMPAISNSNALNMGDVLESADLKGGTVTRMRFNIGCNDNESIDVLVSYLPLATPTIPASPTNAASKPASPTSTATATRTVTPASAVNQPPTRVPTLTPLPTITPARPAR